MDLHRRTLARPLPPKVMEIANNEQGNHSETSAAYRLREVTVTGTAEVCSPADRASARVSVGSSSKDSANEATNSVSRRVGYILQTLR